MKVKKNDRGFRLVEFIDFYGIPCSIQESSLATEQAIWLGRDYARMHLSQAQVQELLPLLQHFAETGELPEETPC